MSGGARVRRTGDTLVVDMRGLTSQQRGHVRVVATAITAGLLSDLPELMANGTALEVREEPARRLRDLRCSHDVA